MKRPYFIHFGDNEATTEMKELQDLKEEEDEDSLHLNNSGSASKVDNNAISGRILTMAGLFDIWTEGPEVCMLWCVWLGCIYSECLTKKVCK